MRTTLTLDDDVATELARLRKARGERTKDIVNQALRLGLRALTERPRRLHEPFRTRTVSLGACRIGSLDNIAEALAIAEGDDFR